MGEELQNREVQRILCILYQVDNWWMDVWYISSVIQQNSEVLSDWTDFYIPSELKAEK